MDSNSDSMRPQKSARRSAGSAARSAATAALAVLALGAAASFSLFGVPHASADTAPQTYAPALAVPASIRMLQGPKPGKGAGWKQCAEVVFGQPDLASRDLSNGAGWEAALEVAGGSVYKFGSDVLAQYAAAVVSFEHAERKGADTASSDSSSSSSFAALNQQQAGERPMAPPERHIYTLKGATPASGQLPAIQFCVDYLHRWASTISLFSLQSSVDSVKTADQSRLRYLGADGQAYSLEPRETEAAAVAAQRKNQRHIVKVRQDASAGAFVPNWDTGVCQCLANPAAQRNAMNLKGATQTTTAAQQTTAAPPPPPPVPDVAPQTSTVARTQTMTSTTSNTRTTTTKPKPSPTGVIAGRVYLDANGNGIYDDGETGIPGVRLTLTGTDTQNVVQNIQVTTDPDGLYSFVDLWGTNSGFTITETQPTGFTNAPGSPATVITVAKLTNGQSLLGQDFGELAVSVTGTIFVSNNKRLTERKAEFPGLYLTFGPLVLLLSQHDTIGNGLFGDGLNPIPNVTVKIYNTDSNGLKTGSPIYTTTSDYMGGYMFAPVTAGQLYVIERDLPTGYKDPTKGAITLTVNVTNQGLVNYGNDFPLLLNSPVNPNPAGTIGGVVYVDWNNNGLFDQETGISGVVLRLTGTDDLGTKISRLQITKPNGMFKWIGLRPGNYSIREYQPTGAYDSLGPTTSITGIVVVDGTNSLSNNFGEIVLWTQTLSTTTTFTSTSKTTITTTFVSATVGGRIAVDLNNNGAFNDFEPGLRSVTVRATGTNIFGAPVTTSAVTDCTGYYQFVMAAGDYTVSKTNLAGYVDAPNAVLKSSTNINVRGIAQYHNWLVVTDTSVMGSNTTNGCAISGRVYVDTQPVDNFFNISKENTITGVTIRLTGTAIDGTKVNVTTTSTSCTAAGCGSTNGCTNTLCADTVCTGQPVAKINMNGMFYFTGRECWKGKLHVC